MEVESAAALEGALLTHDVLRDEIDVVHHADGIAEDVPVDLLHQKLPDFLPVIESRVIGRVDMAVGDEPVEDQFPGQSKLSADVDEFFFDSCVILQDFHHQFYAFQSVFACAKTCIL